MSEENKCRHYNEIDDDREYCQLTYNIFKKKCKTKCKDIKNCYYKQLQTAKEENEKLKSKNATLKMYKYWGEILKEAQPKIDELQEYLIKNQLFDFAQKLLFTRKENIALTQQNKQMREALRLACISLQHDDTLDVQPIIDMYMEMATYV